MNPGLSISSTGVVSYSGSALDQDGSNPVTSYTLTVTATSNGISTTKNAVLNVTNIDDAPVFSSSTPSTLSIDENATSKDFGTITATDEDDDDSLITFSLVAAEGATTVPDGFAITSAGVLSYNGTGINREDLPEDGVVIVRVQALSDGVASTTDIDVTVNDVDEFDPVFTDSADFTVSPGSLSIDEDAISKTFTEDFSATDADSTTNAITYSISGLTGLSISSAGVVSYSGSALDQDGSTPVTSYTLTVTATSNGKSTTKDAVLNVTAVDDAPVFTDSTDYTSISYGLNIDEDEVSKTFTEDFSAADEDNDDSAITYSLSSTLTGLTIDSTGVVSYTGSALDQGGASPVTSYDFIVTATSNGISITKDGILFVNELNNNTIIFDASSNNLNFNFNVNENDAGNDGTVLSIGTVLATNDDNSSIRYTLVSPPDHFFIGGNTGAITYDGEGFNHEVTGEYTLTVRAQGSVSSSNGYTDQNFTVTIIDVNDAPVVSTAFPSQVMAATTATSFTIPLSTFGDEDGDTLYYSFAVTDENNTDTSSWLTFDASSGVFSVSDQSVAGIYNVTLTVADGVASTALTASTVFALYIGASVVPPEFDLNASYSFDLNENDTVEDLGSVIATDPDSSAATISYDLVAAEGETSVPAGFSIDSTTGAISYTGAGFDYEVLTDKFVALRVQATSTEGADVQTSMQDVTINILDIDDAPVFTNAPYAFSIDEGASGLVNGVFVGQVTATDQDLSGTLKYAISGSASRAIFDIDSEGNINYIGAGFDYDTTTSYSLSVYAYDDNVSGSNIGTGIVNISITDII